MSPLAARWQKLRPFAVPALVFLALVLALFWRLWTPIDGARRTFGWDAQWEYWGDLAFQLDAYRAGELPLWNPFDRAGYPFHADPQAGLLYPPNWVLLFVGALTGGAAWWLVAVKCTFHFWLAGLGVYAFLRRRGTPTFACYAGGLLFILTYPYVHNLFSALNWSMAWAPWALLAIDAWAERPERGRAALVALAVAMGILAGAWAAVWYSLLVAIPYGAWAVLHHRGRAADPRAYLRAALGSAALAALLLGAMVAAQLDATTALVAETVRDTRDLDFIAITAFTADDLVSFVVPRFPGENCYFGIAAIAWVVALLTLRPSPRTFVLASIALLGVLCAWGDILGFLPFSASAFPPFGFFRRAHRYLFVTALPFALLAAEGLAFLATLEGAELRRRVATGLVRFLSLAALFMGLAFAIKATTPHQVEPYREAFGLGFASAAVAAWLCRQLLLADGRWRLTHAWLAVVALGLDLLIARAPVIDRNMHAVPDVTADRELAALAGVPREARLYDREYLKFRPGIRHELRDLGGYEGDPLALRRYARMRDAVTARPAALGHANVRWLLESDKKATRKSEPGALRPVKKGIYEVAKVAPTVMWVDRAIVVDGDDRAALTELLRHAPGTTVVLERGTLPAGFAALATVGDEHAPAVAGRLTRLERNRVTAEIDAPAEGVVVVHEAVHPGWRATVDGVPTPIVPANALFRGVLVGAGHHALEFTYAAPRAVALAPLSLLAMLTALALAWRGCRSSCRRDDSPAPPPADSPARRDDEPAV